MIKKPKPLHRDKPQSLRIAKVQLEGPMMRSYVIRVYDNQGRLWDFFDSMTSNPQAALDFIFFAVRTKSDKIEKLEFGEGCKELEVLWKKNLRSKPA